MPEPVLTVGLILAGYTALAPLARRNSAVSAEAEAVRENAEAVEKQTERSFALFGAKAEALSELSVLAAECLEADWDGYGAHAVDACSVGLASEIIRALPSDLPMPSIAIEPDGCVSLDWLPTRTRTFTLSVGKSDRLPYAWIDGTDRGHAVARFVDGRLAPRILDEIRRICGHESAVRAA